MSAASSPPSSPSSSSPAPPQEKTSAFERWRRTASLITGLGGVTEEERKEYYDSLTYEHCEKKKMSLLESSPLLVFMQKHLRLSGCPVPPEHIKCGPCDELRAGGFEPSRGTVSLCAASFFSKQHMESTIAHELLHMFDHCRFNVDWTNLRHHACSEIRANSLSGDCIYRREWRRGNVSFTKNHQACVRRRAIVSVAANPFCPDEETAERAVNEVFDSCFKDTRPFDEIY